MIGTSWKRSQGMADQLIHNVMRNHGVEKLIFGLADRPEKAAAHRHWRELAKHRDGPVNPERRQVDDVAAMTAEIKERALALGADKVGIAPMEPRFIDMGVELNHPFAIAMICHESYYRVLEGTDAVDMEAMNAYMRCADIATELARQIREELGYPALAHHNGSTQVQAIPLMHRAGLGELGKHGSLINPDLGANFRPAIVTTDLPLVPDEPVEFGVQDYCLTCNLCTNNCPGDAVSKDYIVTDGIRRWLIDIEKCLPVSRLREDYCHICVDVCPYIHKENGDAGLREAYKTHMKSRKAGGYKTPNRRNPGS